CGLPKPIAKGDISLRDPPNTSYGAMAEVSCNTGYEPTTPEITCTTSGLWENDSCNAIDCGRPLPILNGSITLHDGHTTYGSLSIVLCNPGYLAKVSQIVCVSSGLWENASCELLDCGLPKPMPNGNTSLRDPTNTSYGAMSDVSCNTGYEPTTPQITCTTSGTWENASCNARDCGDPVSIRNGTIVLFNTLNTTYGSLANVSCATGYEHDTSQIMCEANGEWQNASCRPLGANVNCSVGYVPTASKISCMFDGMWSVAACNPIDCGFLLPILNGQLSLFEQDNTTYGAKAIVMCSIGYTTNFPRITCMANGQWEQASCDITDQTKVVCETNVDHRGTEWKKISQGSTRVQQCEEGFEGNITRTCLKDGNWQLPQYNCVRKTVTNVAEKVETFVSNATADIVSIALEQIVNVTGNEAATKTSELLTDAEITVLASILERVAEIVLNKSLPTENVVKESNGGVNMLASVDKIGVALREKVASGEEGFTNITIVQKNVALEVKKVNKQDIVFPYEDIKIDQHEDQFWAKTSKSSILLKAKAIGRAKTNDQHINGPILSLSLSNHFGKLKPPVLLTFERMK
ncbi:hypothetical protein DPMN_051287, partial [Dreissena polymorpha]